MRNGSRAVKKLLLLGVGSALMVTMGGVGPAQADNGPHVSSAFSGAGTQTVGTDKCASCHRAHTSKAPYNLLQAQPALCYTCHGSGATGGVTDVADGLGKGTAPGALRAGGFEMASLNAAAPQKVWVAGTGTSNTGKFVADPLQTKIGVLPAAELTTSAHNITGAAAGIAWGNGDISATGKLGKSITLQCGSCHDPHGNGNYRILKPIPDDSTGATPFVLKAAVLAADGVTVTTPAVMSSTSGIKIPDAPGTDAASRGLTHKYTTTNYWLAGDSNVPVDPTATLTGTAKAADPVKGTYADLPADGYINNIAAWCTTCHTRYLAGSGSHKTDSGDSTFTYRHRSDANYKSAGANCITCHVAHGTNAKMSTGGNSAAVTLPGGGTAVGLKGASDSRLLRVDNRGICIMCHNV
jgi:predicted CXXCH cytochrome family protein